MTLLMGVLPKGEAGLPMLDFIFILVSLYHHWHTSCSGWREAYLPAALGLTYVDYLQHR